MVAIQAVQFGRSTVHADSISQQLHGFCAGRLEVCSLLSRQIQWCQIPPEGLGYRVQGSGFKVYCLRFTYTFNPEP